jgi:hypothetical protein
MLLPLRDPESLSPLPTRSLQLFSQRPEEERTERASETSLEQAAERRGWFIGRGRA